MKAATHWSAALVILFVCLSTALGEGLNVKLDAAFEAGQLAGLHGVLVRRKGKNGVEAHFQGKDERWGSPLGMRDHGANSIHDLRSVTEPIG